MTEPTRPPGDRPDLAGPLYVLSAPVGFDSMRSRHLAGHYEINLSDEAVAFAISGTAEVLTAVGLTIAAMAASEVATDSERQS